MGNGWDIVKNSPYLQHLPRSKNPNHRIILEDDREDDLSTVAGSTRHTVRKLNDNEYKYLQEVLADHRRKMRSSQDTRPNKPSRASQSFRNILNINSVWPSFRRNDPNTGRASIQNPNYYTSQPRYSGFNPQHQSNPVIRRQSLSPGPSIGPKNLGPNLREKSFQNNFSERAYPGQPIRVGDLDLGENQRNHLEFDEYENLDVDKLRKRLAATGATAGNHGNNGKNKTKIPKITWVNVDKDFDNRSIMGMLKSLYTKKLYLKS